MSVETRSLKRENECLKVYKHMKAFVRTVNSRNFDALKCLNYVSTFYSLESCLIQILDSRKSKPKPFAA